jgi:CMP-N-acetylneuraminic acid synthetase
MRKSQEIWAIIPTKEGSSGLLRKNTREIANKPMLYYMLMAALRSKRLSRVILTTDSDHIAEIALRLFPDLEVIRHDRTLSKFGQPSFKVFQYALKHCIKEKKIQPAAVALLRITTPLCLSSDIDNAINLLLSQNNKTTSVLSVTKSDVHPERVYIIDKKGLLIARENTPEKYFPLPRQTFDDVYIRNGAIYATYSEMILRGYLWKSKLIPYVMPKNRSININDGIDFILAEELLKRQYLKTK